MNGTHASLQALHPSKVHARLKNEKRRRVAGDGQDKDEQFLSAGTEIVIPIPPSLNIQPLPFISPPQAQTSLNNLELHTIQNLEFFCIFKRKDRFHEKRFLDLVCLSIFDRLQRVKASL